MSKFGSTAKDRIALQRALNSSGIYPVLIAEDGVWGTMTGRVITLYRAQNSILPAGAVVDNKLLRSLGLGVPLITQQGTLGNIVLDLVEGVVEREIEQRTGIKMDFSKISKAIAGLFAGAGAAGGSAAYAYISLPASVQAVLPSWVAPDITIVNTIIGAIVGFAIVYFAPANKPS